MLMLIIVYDYYFEIAYIRSRFGKVYHEKMFLYVSQALTCVKVIINSLIRQSSIKSLDASQGPAANLTFTSSINSSKTE